MSICFTKKHKVSAVEVALHISVQNSGKQPDIPGILYDIIYIQTDAAAVPVVSSLKSAPRQHRIDDYDERHIYDVAHDETF